MGDYRGNCELKKHCPERSEERACEPAERSGAYFYLVTIKRNAIESTKIAWLSLQYSRLVKLLPGCEWSSDVSYELDSLNRLHLHTIVQSPREVYYKKLTRKGWHIHFARFPRKDYSKVLNYIRKHDQHPMEIQQREIESEIYNMNINNLFQM